MSLPPTARLQGLPHLPLLALAATAILTGSSLILRGHADSATVVSATTLDLVVILPLVYYLLGVRGLGLPPITVLPVFRLSLEVAGLLLPQGQRPLYESFALLARPTELVLAGYVLWRLHLGGRALRRSPAHDLLQRWTIAVRTALPRGVPSADRAADLLAFEFALGRYATRAPGSGAEVPPGAQAFPGHRSSGWTAIALALLLVLAVEVVAVHLLVALWSPVAAWVLTGLSLYGGLWILGDLRAIRSRPTWVGGGRVSLRQGIRWTVEVPLSRVRSARVLRPGESVTGALDLALPNARRVLVELRTPASARGPYGMAREVSSVVVGVDDPQALLDAFLEAD